MTALTTRIPTFEAPDSLTKVAVPAGQAGTAWSGFDAVVGYPMSIDADIGSVRAA
ncbi:hypothetical protein AB7C87_10910 [Natrarchaeobius sp. A-rgal3]|uniref:hypothetical protein n=1 Tax=Natrarchaeobius versutus TaxID=1679078 RepID=UPI00350F08B0